MSTTCRVGLIGCGRWGRHILRDLISLACRVEVVARDDASRENADVLGAAAYREDVTDLGEVEGIVVATPTVTHAEVIESILPRGVPVFVEKPLTPNLTDAERIVEAAGDRVFVMDKWRYHHGVLALAKIAASGELGRVLGMQMVRVQWRQPHPDVDCSWILAPHDLSIFQEVVGPLPEPRAAVAEWGPDGLVGLSGTLGVSPWLTLEVGSRRPEHVRTVRLVCEGGYAELADGWADSVTVLRDDGENDPEPESRPIGTAMPLLAELRAFVTHLRGGPAPRSSASDALATVRAITQLRALAGVEG